MYCGLGGPRYFQIILYALMLCVFLIGKKYLNQEMNPLENLGVQLLSKSILVQSEIINFCMQVKQF